MANLMVVRSKTTKKYGLSFIKTKKGFYFELSFGLKSWIWSFNE